MNIPVIVTPNIDMNNTLLLNNTYTLYSDVFSASGEYPANYNIQIGSRYALSFLIIANTMPTIYGIQNISFLSNLSPKINGISSGQNDLITNISDINITSNNNIQWIKLS